MRDILLLLILVVSLAVVERALARAPKSVDDRSPYVAIRVYREKGVLFELVRCYNLSLKSGRERDERFGSCVKPLFQSNMSSLQVHDMTMFLSLAQEITESRSCTASEKTMTKEPASTTCFNLKMRAGGKKRGFLTVGKDRLINKIRLF